jgi:alkaline phosphatase
VKVNNGTLSMSASGKKLETLLELARNSGRMTGLVTNGNVTDIASAAFYAHQTSHDREAAARELVEKANFDVVFGGGKADFLPVAQDGHRTDERDLLKALAAAGYDLVETKEELEEVPRWRRAKLFGLFSDTEVAFADEAESGEEHPTLADMVRRGIELLQYHRGGYLLVVHAGLMRKAAQENDGLRTLLETVELDRAVSVATRYAGAKSLIIVCGDVGLGGLHLNGFPPRGEGGLELLEDRRSPTGEPWLTWASGPKGPPLAQLAEPTLQLQLEPFETPPPTPPSPAPREEPASIFAETARPTAGDVVAFGTGLGANQLHGTLESTRVFEIIRDNL